MQWVDRIPSAVRFEWVGLTEWTSSRRPVGTSRWESICIHSVDCGNRRQWSDLPLLREVIAADRKRYCNHCGREFLPSTAVAGHVVLPEREVSPAGILLGLAICLAFPLSSFFVAFLWDRGVIGLDPNGAFVQTLQWTAVLEIFLGPAGIAVAGWSASVHGLWWLVLGLIAVPVLAVVWFIGVAYLGGLAGEPF